MKKILFLTRNALRSNISTGNTINNIFNFIDKKFLFNIYCRDEIPDLDICSKYFCISESELMHFKKNVGKEININGLKTKDFDTAKESKKIYNTYKKRRLTIFLWLRELIWASNSWKSKQLNNFLYESKPDIIYMPIYDCFYMHRVLYYIKKKTNAKILLFSGDDFYCSKKTQKSIFQKINAIILKKYIKKTMDICDAVFCLSSEQIKLYSKIFKNTKFIQIYKSMDFKNVMCRKNKKNKKVINILFSGNIDYGRWKTINLLINSINELAQKNVHFKLDIYTGSAISDKLIVKDNENVKLNGLISYDELIVLQKKYDVLLNVESFDKIDIERVKLSFSTKIVDYLYSGNFILTIGPKEVNSVSYLLDNEASLCIINPKNITSTLENLYLNQNLMYEFSNKSIRLGKENHDSLNMQKKVTDTINNL